MSLELVRVVGILCLINTVYCRSVREFTKITFIYRDYKGHSYRPNVIEKVLNHPDFNRDKPTVLYSYGLTETPYQPSVRNVVDAYLENDGFNFMVISCDSIIDYTIFNADEIAQMVAEGLVSIMKQGYDQFHLVGFSLGAQIAGLIGRKIIKMSENKFKIPRITGLDPGKLPPFISVSIEFLNPNDATFVDIIHAESKYFGSAETVGHSMFWANGGRSQPMCKHKLELITSVCSHLMAPKFWAESVRSNVTSIFPALKCNGFNDYKLKNCDTSAVNHMGLHTDTGMRGHFYLDTNHFPPYSREI